MQAETKKQSNVTEKDKKKVQAYLSLRCKLAFAFIKDRDISC